jgi:hypothetical protein
VLPASSANTKPLVTIRGLYATPISNLHFQLVHILTFSEHGIEVV